MAIGYHPRRLNELATGERPQERLEKAGASALSDTELLAMLLRSGSRELDVLGLSSSLIREAGSLAGLTTWSAEDFRAHPGIGQVKALQLVAVMEVARRVLCREGVQAPVFDAPERVAEHLRAKTLGLEVEKFWVLCLNRKNRLLRCAEVTSGTATSSLAHPREIFREAIRHGASAIIAAHNHPSGDPAPSQADQRVTRQLAEAAQVIGIELLDHVIVGHPARDPRSEGFYSFASAGLI